MSAMQLRLEHFREDNPVDVGTQAKRLLASDDKRLILYTLELGLTASRSRQRHNERSYIKTVGEAPQTERLVAGPVTGSVRVLPTRKTQNALAQYIADIWRINGDQKLGDATHADLSMAIRRETSSADGHTKNAQFYKALQRRLGTDDSVRAKWGEGELKAEIKRIYGTFRVEEAA